MKTSYQFDGQDLFISEGSRMHRVYPAKPGTYWFDRECVRGDEEIRVLVVDDFGNMVDGFGGAPQRAHFRKTLH